VLCGPRPKLRYDEATDVQQDAATLNFLPTVRRPADGASKLQQLESSELPVSLGQSSRPDGPPAVG